MVPHALVPTSLTLRRSACFYCGEPHNADLWAIPETRGLRCCTTHKATAARDLKAHLHTLDQVRTDDALAHPLLAPFLEQLKSPTTIQRSSGVWEGDWTLQEGPDCRHWTLLRLNGVWHIPMKHASSNSAKRVPLPIFCTTAFTEHNSHSRLSPIDAIQAALDEGLYKEEYEAAYAHGSPSHVDETPGVYTVYDPTADALVRVVQ